MKKTYLLLLLPLFFCSLTAKATTHTITVQNFQFSPASITTVHVGDTIKWMWVNGVHTTTSLAIPASATSWDHNMNQTSQTFLYKVTVIGTYNYECVPHSPDMKGSFTASPVSAVPGIANAEPTFVLRGNVVRDELKIGLDLDHSAQVSIQLYNLVGRLIRTYSDDRRETGTYDDAYPVGDLPKGLYLLAVKVGNQQTTRRVIVE